MAFADELINFSIFHLREIARNVGVKAPTTLKKEKLIEEINNISNGKTLPYFSMRGRPALKSKEVFIVEQSVCDVKKKQIEDLIEKLKIEILKVLSED